MAFTLAGFYEGATTTQVVGANITPVQDAHLKNEGEAVIVPELNRLIGFSAGGVTLQDVQVVSPSLRRTCLMDISPIDISDSPVSPPDPILLPNGAPTLDFDEELTVIGTYGAGSEGTSNYAVAFLGDNNCNPVSGQMFTVKGTLASFGTAGTWAAGTLTLTQSLPVGNYKIVGARLQHAEGVAFRFVFIGGIWRPGHMCVADDNSKDVPMSRHGALGVWGSFSHNREPGVEVFTSVGGAAAGVIYIDIMRA